MVGVEIVGSVIVGRVTVVGSVIGGGGRSAAAEATHPAMSPTPMRATWTRRRRKSDFKTIRA
jgi:hypothetical protein